MSTQLAFLSPLSLLTTRPRGVLLRRNAASRPGYPYISTRTRTHATLSPSRPSYPAKTDNVTTKGEGANTTARGSDLSVTTSAVKSRRKLDNSAMSTPTTTCILQGALTLTPSNKRRQQPYTLSSSLPSSTTILLSSSSPGSQTSTPISIPVPFYSSTSAITDSYYTPTRESFLQNKPALPRPTQKTVLPPQQQLQQSQPLLPPLPPTQPQQYQPALASTAPKPPVFPSLETTPLLPTTAPEATTTTPPPVADDEPNPLWPRLILLLVAVIWGTNFPTVKILQTPPDPMSAANAALARFALATLSLVPFALKELRSNTMLPDRALLSAGLISGVPVFAGYLTQAIALTETDAGKCAFMCSLGVVVVPILTRLFPSLVESEDELVASEEGETVAVEGGSSEQAKSAMSTWGAPILAVAGVALLELAGASAPNVGDVWAGMQAIGFALGYIFNEKLAKNYPAYSLTATTLQLTSITMLSFIWAGAEASWHAGAPALPALAGVYGSATNLSAIIYAGVVSTAVTLWLVVKALKKVSAGELAVLLSTEPMWAAALSAVALDERMGAGAIVGGALILAACIVNQADALGLEEKMGAVKFTQVGERFRGAVDGLQRLFRRQ